MISFLKKLGFFVLLGVYAISILADDSASSSATTKKLTRFAVINDIPYSDSEYAALEHPDGVIAKAIKALNPPVLIHLGDF